MVKISKAKLKIIRVADIFCCRVDGTREYVQNNFILYIPKVCNK